jgi:hypothetical protein
MKAKISIVFLLLVPGVLFIIGAWFAVSKTSLAQDAQVLVNKVLRINYEPDPDQTWSVSATIVPSSPTMQTTIKPAPGAGKAATT